MKMKPLLGATRTAGEVKKRDEKIQQLESKIQQSLDDRRRIEDDRRRADIEVQRIQHTLESERALAFDKEEIFKRLQNREAELNEKLADAIADQETLEEQLDNLLRAKKKVEEELDLRRTQVEQAGSIITRLESEKDDLQRAIEELDSQLEEVEKNHTAKDGRVEALDQEIRVLNSQLSLKDRKVQELEAKLLKTDQELDIKLANTTKDLNASRKQVKDLLEENRSTRQQLSELSSSSNGYEDLLRQKESELATLRGDLRRHESEKRTMESEHASLVSRHDSTQSRLREIQAEMDAMRSQRANLEREALDAKILLEAKISQDAESGESRRILDEQIADLRGQLLEVQAELSRERQSRDDVQMLGEHKLTEMKEKYDHLNESKIIIEKELYVQQDALRRETEARAAVEQSRKDLQSELIKLRERFTAVENARVEAENERAILKQSSERQAALKRDLDLKTKQTEETEAEKSKLSLEIQRLRTAMMESDNFRIHHDQHKERLERELVTVKGRLTASENDNKALLNKIQQKNLDIARSTSRVGDSQKVLLTQVQNEKSKLEEENKKLSRQLADAALSITSLEKQKDRLEALEQYISSELQDIHSSVGKHPYEEIGISIVPSRRRRKENHAAQDQ